MSSHSDSLSNPMIERRIEELKAVPARNPLQAASGRARFLREAAEYRQTVSTASPARQSGWTTFIRKEKLAMTALVSFLLAASLLLGGGATVAAAQDDLPDQSLYQIKLWTENATLAMTGEPQEQAELLMTMAQTRVEEMAALAEKGVTPPDRVRERLETHLRQTLLLAAGMDDTGLEKTLLQVRERLQNQDRILQKLQEQAGAQSDPVLARTRQMLQLHLRLAEQGLADPQAFRYTLRNRWQYGPDESATPGPYRQGEPGFHQPTAQPPQGPGAGNGNSSCDGDGSPCGPNPEAPQGGECGNGPCGEEPGGPNPGGPGDGNGNGDSGNEEPKGPNPEAPKGGNGSGSDNGGDSGSGSDSGGDGGSGSDSGGAGSGGDNGGGGGEGGAGGGNK